MNALVLRGDAASLPLADESVDLIVTSPPYFGLRSYTDGGEHYAGQIGSEATPREFLEALWACTREWMRVLKPEGSMFINLGDKYSERSGPGHDAGVAGRIASRPERPRRKGPAETGVPPKSLLGMPWRYALGCIDDLGLILRAEIVWSKPNGLPESVTDRVRRSHEQVFHMTKQPRYFSAVDEVREAHAETSIKRAMPHRSPPGRRPASVYNGQPEQTLALDQMNHPLGKLPGSVWEIPSQPLTVPEHLGVDHFAAFPMELPRRIILGWSPSGICAACGQGRRPVMAEVGWVRGKSDPVRDTPSRFRSPLGRQNGNKEGKLRAATGYACACTPYTDHAGTGGSSGAHYSDRAGEGIQSGGYPNTGAGWGGKQGLGDRPKTGPWREYHLDDWDAPPVRPAIVLDPFGGTGTTALVASAYGRTGISVDRSADYCRLARWRTSDPAERARAMQVPKPPPVMNGQESLFDGLEVTG